MKRTGACRHWPYEGEERDAYDLAPSLTTRIPIAGRRLHWSSFREIVKVQGFETETGAKGEHQKVGWEGKQQRQWSDLLQTGKIQTYLNNEIVDLQTTDSAGTIHHLLSPAIQLSARARPLIRQKKWQSELKQERNKNAKSQSQPKECARPRFDGGGGGRGGGSEARGKSHCVTPVTEL